MIKKILYILMIVKTAAKALAMAVVLTFGARHLPMMVLFASGIIIAVGIFMIVKRIRNVLRNGDLAVYYGLDALQIIFNLIVVSIFSAMHIGFWEYVLIGTILDILIDAVMIILALRRGRYVDIRNVMDAREDGKDK